MPIISKAQPIQMFRYTLSGHEHPKDARLLIVQRWHTLIYLRWRQSLSQNDRIDYLRLQDSVFTNFLNNVQDNTQKGEKITGINIVLLLIMH